MAFNNRRFWREQLQVMDEVELDPENPRIRLRQNADPNQCIERLAESEGSHLVNLCRHIAQNGLGVNPLVAEARGQERVVKDGNRRLACLKMLQNPNLAPESIQERIGRIAAEANFAPEELEFEVSEDHIAILEHMRREHTGEGGGEGTRDWKTIEIARFELDYGFRGDDEEAARILRFAEDENLAEIPLNLPITTLTRFLNQDRIREIGFSDLSPRPPELNQPPGVVHQRVQKIIHDLSAGIINVKRTPGDREYSFMYPGHQTLYLNELLSITPVETGEQDQQPSENEKQNGNSIESEKKTGEKRQDKNQSDSQSQKRYRGGSYKEDWDRDKVIKYVGRDGIPRLTRGKVGSVNKELQRINVQKNPIACAVLIRMFIEFSVENYIQNSSVKDHKENLPDRLGKCIDNMVQNGRFEKKRGDILKQYAGRDLLSIRTLHGIVHDPNFQPDYQIVNKTWDNLLEFLQACWEV